MGDDLLFKEELNQFYTSKSVYKSCRAPLHVWKEVFFFLIKLFGAPRGAVHVLINRLKWCHLRRRQRGLKTTKSEDEINPCRVGTGWTYADLCNLKATTIRLSSLWEICIVGNVGNSGAKEDVSSASADLITFKLSIISLTMSKDLIKGKLKLEQSDGRC